MNIYKKIALFLVFVLIFTAVPCVAGAEEKLQLVANGSFENIHSSGIFSGWLYPSNAIMGENVLVETERVNEGTQAVKLISDSESLYISQKVAGVSGKSTYTLEYMTWIASLGGRGGAVKLEFSTTDESGAAVALGSETIEVTGKLRRWEKHTKTFTTPADTTLVRIYLRLPEGGEIIWDDVAIYGDVPPDLEPLPCEGILPPVTGTGELLKNGDFENVDGEGMPADWTPMGRDWAAGAASLDTEIFHGGKASVKISTETGGNPWVRQRVPVQPRTKYQITAWIRKVGVAEITRGAIRYKYEGISKDGVYMNRNTMSEGLVLQNERQWTQITQNYTAPDDCYFVDFYLRLHSTGTVWFDDVTFRQVEEAPAVSLNTDCVFYYPDQAQGFAKAKRHTAEAVYADFALMDGETVLYAQENNEFFEEEASFAYNLSYLSEKEKEYTIAVTVKDSEKAVLYAAETDIYKYDRPTVIDENQNYLNVDGSRFIPTIGYHVPEAWYEKCAEAGINTVQIAHGNAHVYPEDPSKLDNIFKELEKYNLKGLICLYTGMVPASHPSNIEATKAVVEAYKDNPNVFGYAVMDEPFEGIANSYEDAPYYLKEAYKTIRGIDKNHPVYLLECAVESFEQTAKYCDVFVYDPYPGDGYEPAVHVRNCTEVAVTAARGVKPTYAVHQAYYYRNYFPDITAVRSFWYQALLSGSHGEGYYCIEDSYNTLDIDETELWPGLTAFAKNEQEFAYDVFGYGNYPVFNRRLGVGEEYRSVLKDGSVYMVVLNREAQEKNITVPLLSSNGKVSLSGKEMQVMFGGKNGDAVQAGDMLTVIVEGRGAVVLSFEAENITAGQLEADRYADIESCTWAKEAIEILSAEDILDGTDVSAFSPSVPVTRAEFAKAIVRTLGLCAEEYDMENVFSDIPTDAHYLRELAIGKTLGIFTGVGDGLFNPDANITRQDAIVLCVRALRYVNRIGGEGSVNSLAQYTDGADVAEYARFPMASMITSSVIKGDDTGALKPLANLTRAESAVILFRMRELGAGL